MFRSIFSSKFTTAIISDSTDQIYLVPIRHTIGNYFVTELDKTLHVFKMGKPKQYHGLRKNVFSLIFYDTSHYKPLNSKSSELELVLKKNSLPKVNSSLAKIFKALGSKEKKDFTSHKLEDLIKDLSELKDNKKKQSKSMKIGYNYDDKFANVINYLKSLNVEEIVTPLKSVSEYIQDDVIATDPSFMGLVISNYQRTDIEHKLMTNSASLGKISKMKLLMFITLIGTVIVLGVVMYDMGFFDGNNPLGDLLPSIDANNSLQFDPSNDAIVQDRYPTGKSLQNAINSGAINYDDLSPNVQSMLDSLE